MATATAATAAAATVARASIGAGGALLLLPLLLRLLLLLLLLRLLLLLLLLLRRLRRRRRRRQRLLRRCSEGCSNCLFNNPSCCLRRCICRLRRVRHSCILHVAVLLGPLCAWRSGQLRWAWQSRWPWQASTCCRFSWAVWHSILWLLAISLACVCSQPFAAVIALALLSSSICSARAA